MATSIAGSAVGTFYGGPVGGAVGGAAAKRASTMTKSLCGGLDRIGLTRGDFRTSQLGKALKQTANAIGKDLINPQKLLADATAVGGAYAGGSLNPTALLNKFGGAQIQKLGLNAILKNVPGANVSALLRSVGVPVNASSLLRAAGLPSNASALLRSAGLPSNASALLRSAGLPSNLTAVLRSAGIPADAQSVLRATGVLQANNMSITPQSIAKVLRRSASQAARASARASVRGNVNFNFPAGSAAALLTSYV